VIAVAPEEDCPRDLYRYRDGAFHASPYPRAIGVPARFNLQGASFAVANMTGFAARALARASMETVRETLIAQAFLSGPLELTAERALPMVWYSYWTYA
jgi:hypothetical protein